MTGAVKLQGLLVVFGAMLIGAAGGVLLERIRDNYTGAFASGKRSSFSARQFWTRQTRPIPRRIRSFAVDGQEQRNSIDSIFRAWEPRTDSVMNEVFPRIRALRDTVRMEVDAVLTPEQREELGKMPQFGRDGRDGRNRSRNRGPDGPPRRPPPDQ